LTYPGIEKFFDILEEVKKEEQTTIETLFEHLTLKESVENACLQVLMRQL